MPGGFFSKSELTVVKEPTSLLPKCGACGLYKTCRSPKMPPTGRGRKRILIVAEAPGKDEDDQGIQLVGNSGRELTKTLQEFQINMRKDCWLTNALICRPVDNKITDAKVIDYCRPNLINTIKELEPEIIILLGGTAVESLIPYVWKEDVGLIGRWVGWQIPCQKLNAWICPTYHPSFILRENKNLVPGKLFKQHLEAAVSLEGRPWNKVPNYEERVEVFDKPDAVIPVLKDFIRQGGEVAFDFENHPLKPDRQDSRIVCCSVCWNGKRTVSFPWYGPVIDTMKELLLSDLGKIASNMKHEQRWCMAKLGLRVNNWVWDTMNSAHALDHREGITSIKFQSFVLLGQQSYDDSIHQFLSKGKISEINMRQLMVYCGCDSLLEYLASKVQRKQMGVHNGG